MIDFVLNKSLIGEAKNFGFSEIVYIKDIKAVEGKNDNIIRKAFENENIDIVYGIEKFRIKDKMHYKD
ncbi:MAG: hypothetical protein KKG75_04855, partial [Nanoarchaeota archaeon]|nr:hypothetical protein [Nanoarchaeota archaeon]